MSKFQSGDKVVCVNDHDIQISFELKKGKTYTVKSNNGTTVSLEEIDGSFWLHRFEPALTKDTPAPPKPADWRMQYDNSSARRKDRPVFDGCLQYAPAALLLVSELSRLGNDKHNPGQPLHHARGKSSDHGNCIIRHQMTFMDVDLEVNMIEAVHVAWRALMQLQEIAEKHYGWPKAPRAQGDAP